jgi:DNA repair protein RecO (recombination protein O)
MVSKVKLFERDVGYLIRSVDYGDNHRIVSFLTQGRGRLDAIALGAKKSQKRFGPALDFLNKLKIEFETRTGIGLRQLSQVELLGTHPLVRGDYDRTWTALEWFKVLGQALKEEGPVPGLFEELDRHLLALGQGPLMRVDHSLRFHLLRTLGYGLDLTRCARCHSRPAEMATLVPSEGGLLCKSCHSPQAAEIQAHFFPTQWLENSDDKEELDHARIGEREKVLTEALAFFLAIPPPEVDRKARDWLSKKERKTTRNHSHEFRVVGRKVGGLKIKRTDKK